MILGSLYIIRAEEDTSFFVKKDNAASTFYLTRREVFYSSGSSRCCSGTLDLSWMQKQESAAAADGPFLADSNRMTFSGVSTVLPSIEERQSQLEFIGSVDSLPLGSPFTEAVQAILTTVEEAADELSGDFVAKALGNVGAVFDWIDDDASTTYFELRLGATNTARAGLAGVEAAACKVYMQSLLLTVLYFEETFYFLLAEADSEEQRLSVDSFFPDLSQRSACYHIPAPPDRKSYKNNRHL